LTESKRRYALTRTTSEARRIPQTCFDREWHTGIEGIPFPNPVTIIEVTGCDYLYPIRKGHLMIAEDGIFFEAVRVGEAPQARQGKRHTADRR
jgi:hypothetical protein